MDNNKPTESKSLQTDLSDLLHSYISKWPLFVVSIVIFTILGAAFCYMRQTRFEVQANVLITDDDKEADLMRMSGLADFFSASASADAELEIIKSFTLYRNVVKELGLNTKYVIRKNILKRIEAFGDTPLRLTAPAEMADTLNGHLHFKVRMNKDGETSVKVYNVLNKKVFETDDKKLPATFKTPYGDFKLETTPEYKADKNLAMSIWFFGYDVAAENLQKEVRCFTPSKKADIITVSYLATNVVAGKRIVNEIVDEYNDRGIEQSRKKARKIADFIDNRLGAIAADLATTESQVEQYKQKNNLTNLSADAEYMMSKKSILEGRLFEAESELATLQLTREMLNDPQSRNSMLPIPSSSESASKIISEYNNLILARMQLEKTAKSGNHKLEQLNDRIDALRRNLFITLDKSITTAKLHVSEIQSSNTESQHRLSQIPRQEREYIDIARQQEIKQSLYVFMLREQEQANMRIANALPKGQIIDRAFAKTRPSGMGKASIILAFMFIGLCFVPVLLYVRDLLRNHVNSADELKKLTQLPVIGQIPIFKDDNYNLRTEEFVSVATSLLFTGKDNRIFAVTTHEQGHGGTYTATNIANAFAAMGHSVVLLDLNFRHSSLSDTISATSSRPGPAKYLAGQLEDICAAVTHNKSNTGYDIIVAENNVPNPALLLASQNLKKLIEQLKAQYKYIVIDAPSANFLSDILSIATISDSNLLVIRAGITTLSQIRKLNNLVRDNSIENAEMIVDGVKPPKKFLGISF